MDAPLRSTFSLRSAVVDGLAAGRVNLRPGVLLWCAAVAIVVGYYFVPPVNDGLEQIGFLKQQYGFLFSGLSTMLFAAVVPLLLGRAFGILDLPDTWGWCVLLAFWTYRGMEVDAFYRLQAWAFGDTNAVPVVVKKILFDQFGYSALWAGPTMVLAYRLRDRKPLPRPGQWRRWYGNEVLPKIIAALMIWIPALGAVYALPGALQLPMSNLISCLWVMIFSFMTDHHTDARGEPVPHVAEDQARS